MNQDYKDLAKGYEEQLQISEDIVKKQKALIAVLQRQLNFHEQKVIRQEKIINGLKELIKNE